MKAASKLCFCVASFTLLLAAGCAFDVSGADPDTHTGADAGDVVRADAGADASNPSACDQLLDHRCLDSNTLQTCGAQGKVTQECGFRCVGPAGAARCITGPPSNTFDPAWLEGASANLEVTSAKRWALSTDTGEIRNCTTGVDARQAGLGLKQGVRFERLAGAAGAPSVGVFALNMLVVSSDSEIVAVGKGALGLLVLGEVIIAGKLAVDGGGAACSLEAACGLVQGSRTCAGPGGSAGGDAEKSGSGLGAGQVTIYQNAVYGGGGGGFGAAGGAGGSASGGAGGGTYGAAGVGPLRGGSGGGGGGSTGDGPGGGGGGALQIISYTGLRVPATGRMSAAGAGGGPASAQIIGGGGGGGSGGTIFLEAPELTLDGKLAANGGGGGGGRNDANPVTPTEGQMGRLSQENAPGGAGSNAGGAGGAGTSPAGAKGAPLSDNGMGSGGGGGGAGRLVLRAASGGLRQGAQAVLSPPASVTTDMTP